MKRNWLTKVSGLILVLTLVTMSLVSGTYAKYTSTITASGEVTVAQWHIDVDDGADTIGTTEKVYTGSFNMVDTLFSDSGIDGRRIAPGAEGAFEIKFDTSDMQVAHNITITLDIEELNDAIPHLELYTDADHNDALDLDDPDAIELLNQNYAKDAGGQKSVKVYWVWEFYVDATQDGKDTLLGIVADTFDVGVSLVATQLDTYTP